MNKIDPNKVPSPIYVVSGGKGLAGNNMVQSLLIQYPKNRVPVIIESNILDESMLMKVISQAKKDGGIIAHTLVNRELRSKLIELANKHEIRQVDFMGELANFLDQELGIPSLQSPGLYREINQQYFERIDAIEFTLNHDDGLSPQRLHEAEIVLCGVSRSGKTPLSVYLALYGWKVANVPLVSGITPPEELFKIDPDRVFGLQIGIPQLMAHRIKRLRSSNNLDNKIYIDESLVRNEIRNASLIFSKGKFSVINVTNKPVESSANEILNIMNTKFNYRGRHIQSPYQDTSPISDTSDKQRNEEDNIDNS